MTDSSAARTGWLCGIGAYLCWGLVPVYFAMLKGVPAGEILAHRVFWSVGLTILLAAAAGRWRDVVRVARAPKLLRILAVSAALLGVNWLLYIHATVTERVAEASLGYFMLPLVNAFLATVVLGERLRPLHWPALGLVACGVAVPVVAAGYLPWLAVGVAVTFGLYGLARKTVAVDSLTGIAVETGLMLPVAGGYLGWVAADTGRFGYDGPTTGLLAFGGLVTLVPLMLFSLSVRRLPLLANTFIQFLSPTMQLVIATVWMGERLTAERWAAMGCVWAAVAVFLADAGLRLAKSRRTVPAPAVAMSAS